MAERLAAAYADQAALPDFQASSAGVRALISHPMHHEAALVLESLGGDASGFTARQFTPRIGADADLVVTMTRAHRDQVLTQAPKLLRRTFTLAEVSLLTTQLGALSFEELTSLRPKLNSYDLADIVDPIGQGVDVFEMVGSQIAELLPPIIDLCGRSSPSAG